MTQPKVLVCDFGFSAMKWQFDGCRGRFRSALRRSHDGIQVGDEVLVKTGASYVKTLDELISYYPIFVREAAKISGVDAYEGEVSLAVGLPYSFFKFEEENSAGMANAHQALRQSLDDLGRFSDIMVIPQGLGGIKAFEYSCNADGGVAGNILGIDIGFNTCIYNLYDTEQRKIVSGDTLMKRGVHDLSMNYLLPLIAHHSSSRSFTPIELSQLIESKEIQRGFELIDIRPEIESAATSYVEALMSDITNDLIAHVGVNARFKNVVIFGGGANLLPADGGIKNGKGINIFIPQEPEFSNAIGFDLVISKALESKYSA
ncbi:hypothetical protein FY034_18130 (plasmid) [Trichlorobacter lovleyi]|uniref:hypothetical protein n=1 Tax=Trichlorobacter lovleyi TaxID=313985 RepID=UPI00223F5EFA|nr:hypothetical protein [Trichlorobacter lovleyi]QOX80920.1 hypothetical protein FY034_18130 [Trichlorobacter lovleyi]